MSNNNIETEGDTTLNIKTSIKPPMESRPPNPGYSLPVLKTPYTKLNSVLGSLGGFRRGELVTVVSDKYNYREGLVNDIYMGLALVNKPAMIDDSKIPVVIDISFGESAKPYQEKMLFRYQELTGDTTSLDYHLLHHRGYRYFSYLVQDASLYTLSDLISYICDVEASGHEIHLLTIGDLSTISRLDRIGNTLALSEILRRMRYFFDERGCTVVTSLPIDESIKSYTFDDTEHKLKEVSRHNAFGDDRHITQTVDTTLLLSLENEELHVHCGKHRGSIMKDDTTIISMDGCRFMFDEPFVETIPE